jgi:hypothetical protein
MDRENEYIFYNIEDILTFAEWVQTNFESTDEYSDWFDTSLDVYVPANVFCTRKTNRLQEMHECLLCGAKFFTPAGLDVHRTVLHQKSSMLDTFWEIINTEYQKENHDNELPDTD